MSNINKLVYLVLEVTAWKQSHRTLSPEALKRLSDAGIRKPYDEYMAGWVKKAQKQYKDSNVDEYPNFNWGIGPSEFDRSAKQFRRTLDVPYEVGNTQKVLTNNSKVSDNSDSKSLAPHATSMSHEGDEAKYSQLQTDKNNKSHQISYVVPHNSQHYTLGQHASPLVLDDEKKRFFGNPEKTSRRADGGLLNNYPEAMKDPDVASTLLFRNVSGEYNSLDKRKKLKKEFNSENDMIKETPKVGDDTLSMKMHEAQKRLETMESLGMKHPYHNQLQTAKEYVDKVNAKQNVNTEEYQKKAGQVLNTYEYKNNIEPKMKNFFSAVNKQNYDNYYSDMGKKFDNSGSKIKQEDSPKTEEKSNINEKVNSFLNKQG